MNFILVKQLVLDQYMIYFYLFSCISQRYSDYISPSQFHEACIDLAADLKEENALKPDEFGFPSGAKFRVLDLRMPHEKEIKDLRDSIVVVDPEG